MVNISGQANRKLVRGILGWVWLLGRLIGKWFRRDITLLSTLYSEILQSPLSIYNRYFSPEGSPINIAVILSYPVFFSLIYVSRIADKDKKQTEWPWVGETLLVHSGKNTDYCSDKHEFKSCFIYKVKQVDQLKEPFSLH